MRQFMMITLVSLVTVGCASTGYMTRNGPALVTEFKESGFATSRTGATKRGEACTKNILGIVSSGDSSIEAAKKAGGIREVSTVDYDITNYFFVYGKACTIVTGT